MSSRIVPLLEPCQGVPEGLPLANATRPPTTRHEPPLALPERAETGLARPARLEVTTFRDASRALPWRPSVEPPLVVETQGMLGPRMCIAPRDTSAGPAAALSSAIRGRRPPSGTGRHVMRRGRRRSGPACPAGPRGARVEPTVGFASVSAPGWEALPQRYPVDILWP